MIYVDNNRIKTRVGNRCGRWSHLFAWPANDNELIAFARKIGLKADWIQKPGTVEAHFDVTDTFRSKALSHGAAFISAHDYGQLLRNEKPYQVHSGGTK